MLKPTIFIVCIFFATLPAFCANVIAPLPGTKTSLRDIVYQFNIAPEHSKHPFDITIIETEEITLLEAIKMVETHIKAHKNVGADEVWNEPAILEGMHLETLGREEFYKIFGGQIAEWHATYDDEKTTISWEDEHALAILAQAREILERSMRPVFTATTRAPAGSPDGDNEAFGYFSLESDDAPTAEAAEPSSLALTEVVKPAPLALAETRAESPTPPSPMRRSVGSACFGALAPSGSPAHAPEVFELTQKIHQLYALTFADAIVFLKCNPDNVIDIRSAKRMKQPELMAILLEEANELARHPRYELEAATLIYILSPDKTSIFDRKKTLGLNKITQAPKLTTSSHSPVHQEEIDRIEKEHQCLYGSPSPTRSSPASPLTKNPQKKESPRTFLPPSPEEDDEDCDDEEDSSE